MTKPTIVANKQDAVEVMASDTMPADRFAVRFGRWVTFFVRGREPETMLVDEVETQDEINRQRKERLKGKI